MNLKIRVIAIVIGVIIAMYAAKNKQSRRSRSVDSASARLEREHNVTDPGDDPRFKAAEAEAMRRWPEFVAAFNKQEPNVAYAVKAKFTDGDASEWMWVQVES